jgi:pimeloyl-ACP methyl ester carboxylesterase
LGGLEARLYAQRWPKEVVGMVLVDTSPAGELLFEANQPGYEEAKGRENDASKMLRCVFLAAHGPLPPSSPDYRDCALPLPSDTPAALRTVFPSFFTAEHAAAQLSLLSSLYTVRYNSVDHRRLGAMPLVVLSADGAWDIDTPAGVRFKRHYLQIWFAQHEALARLSSRGVHRIVRGSGHEIQLDDPQAVADAVDDVLRPNSPTPSARATAMNSTTSICRSPRSMLAMTV